MEELAKEYYRSYVASNEILRVHYFLADQIMDFKPKSVFEFGCGTGKNLKLLLGRDSKLKIHGIDVSVTNIANAHEKNFLDSCYLGDETSLPSMEDDSFDVVFTCSVLDHIWKVGSIIEEFKRIARKGVVLLETNDLIGQYYYAHNYESFGFRKMNFAYISNEASDGDGAKYEIWIGKKELEK